MARPKGRDHKGTAHQGRCVSIQAWQTMKSHQFFSEPLATFTCKRGICEKHALSIHHSSCRCRRISPRRVSLFLLTRPFLSLYSCPLISYPLASLLGNPNLIFESKALDDISDRSRDLIFELVRSKADDLLAGMEFVNWEPTSMRRQPHQYADDLINYLRVTFMNLATLPASIRQAVHFTCMTHICNAILEYATGPKVKRKNASIPARTCLQFASTRTVVWIFLTEGL